MDKNYARQHGSNANAKSVRILSGAGSTKSEEVHIRGQAGLVDRSISVTDSAPV